MRRWFIALALWFLTGAALAGSADPLVRNYRVQADFSKISQGSYETTLEVELENGSAHTLQELLFVLYPGRFRDELPGLNDLNFHRVYPHGVSRGDLVVLDVRNAKGEKLAFERTGDTELQVSFSKPLEPKQNARLILRSRVKVPEKYGSFGRYRGKTTLAGAWTPYLAALDEEGVFHPEYGPPQANWDIRGKTEQNLLIGTHLVRVQGKPKEFTQKFQGARQVSLWFSPEVFVEEHVGRFLKIETIMFEQYNPTSTRFRELIQKWLEFVERQTDLPKPVQKLVMVESPLRRKLAVRGEPYGFFSDRTFKLVRPLQKYHAIPLVHALFYQWFFPHVSRREDSQDFFWVTDALAWRWTEKFIQDRRYEHVDARNIPAVRALSFLFTIDRVIYTPQFAFYDVFYDYVYPVDLVRDDPLLFNHHRPFGRTIYAHVEDELGPSVANDVVTSYFRNDSKAFRIVAQDQGKHSLEKTFSRWMKPRPKVNYVLGEHRKKKTDEKIFHEVDVERISKKSFSEPVELLAKTDGGKTKLLRWKGEGGKHTYRFDTEESIDVLEIDPRHRLWETTLADNRDPPKYKFVVTQYVWTYDFNENEPTISLSGTFRRSYGGANRYNISGGYFGDAYGGSVGYSRLFGRIVDSLRLSHGVGFGFSVNRLDNELVLATDASTGNQAVVETGSKSFVTALSGSYFFGDQLSLTNPLRGGGASFSVTWGSKYFGGDANYFRVGTAGSWVFPLHPNHLLALRGVLRHSGGSEIPSQLQYALGGVTRMKGLSIDDDRFKGKNLLLLSAEYRHFLMIDLDVDLWLFQIRDIQGALFSNWGRVTDTIQETANQVAFGATQRTKFWDLFDPRDFQSDVGYGFRFFIDYLGVSPSLLTFDIAKSLTEWDNGLRFYFGVTQSF